MSPSIPVVRNRPRLPSSHKHLIRKQIIAIARRVAAHIVPRMRAKVYARERVLARRVQIVHIERRDVVLRGVVAAVPIRVRHGRHAVRRVVRHARVHVRVRGRRAVLGRLDPRRVVAHDEAVVQPAQRVHLAEDLVVLHVAQLDALHGVDPVVDPVPRLYDLAVAAAALWIDCQCVDLSQLFGDVRVARAPPSLPSTYWHASASVGAS